MKKPVYNVYASNYNGKKIEIVNFFEYGQWKVIRRELVKVKNKVNKIMTNYLNPTGTTYEVMIDSLKKVCAENWMDFPIKEFAKAFERGDAYFIVRYVVGEKLKKECLYYFWAKCEHEVIIKDMFRDDVEHKADIYEQLTMNWESFRNIVFKDLKLI